MNIKIKLTDKMMKLGNFEPDYHHMVYEIIREAYNAGYEKGEAAGECNEQWRGEIG